MAGVAQKRLASRYRGKGAGFALLAQTVHYATQTGHTFGRMGVEVVAHHVARRR